MADRVVLGRDQYENLLRLATEAIPNEICGFLAGRNGIVSGVYPCRNIAGTADAARMSSRVTRPETGYVMDPREQLRRFHEMGGDENLLAIYHSHPASAPYPSATDRAEARFPPEAGELAGKPRYPGVLYVLLSPVAEPKVRAYRIEGEEVTELPVEIVERS